LLKGSKQMGKFGWSLPPGVTNRMIEEACGSDGQCEICGKHVDSCICPECPVCKTAGDPNCYVNHTMVRSQEQIDSKAAVDKAIAEEEARWDKCAVELEEETALVENYLKGS
jgi:hypothetical protein